MESPMKGDVGFSDGACGILRWDNLHSSKKSYWVWSLALPVVSEPTFIWFGLIRPVVPVAGTEFIWFGNSWTHGRTSLSPNVSVLLYSNSRSSN